MASIAAALIGAGTTWWASKQAKKRSPQERQMEELAANNARLAGQYGTKYLDRSDKALDPVYDYYTKLASGDRNTLMQAFAPEISAQTEGSRQAYQTATELSPRSGIAVEANSRIPMQNAAAIAKIIAGGRPAGIQGLATLGTNWGSLGMSALGQGSNAAGQVLGYQSDRRNEARQAGMDAGDSAYAIFKLIQDATAARGQQKQQQSDFWSGMTAYGPGGSRSTGLW